MQAMVSDMLRRCYVAPGISRRARDVGVETREQAMVRRCAITVVLRGDERLPTTDAAKRQARRVAATQSGGAIRGERGEVATAR